MDDIYKLNTCYPATIISFDPAKQVATCKLAIESYYTGIDYSYKKLDAVDLVDVPVQFPQGGGWDITFPVKPNDPCLVMFSQRGYDHWLYEGKLETGIDEDGNPASEHYRCFSPRDAICILGIRPIPNAIPQFQSEDMDIRNEARTQRITLKANGDIEVATTANVIVNASTATVTASSTTINGDVAINGNVSLNGSMTATADVVAGGISLMNHTHNNKTVAPPDK